MGPQWTCHTSPLKYSLSIIQWCVKLASPRSHLHHCRCSLLSITMYLLTLHIMCAPSYTFTWFSILLKTMDTLTSVMSPSVMSLPLLHPKPLGKWMCLVQISLLVVTFPFHISWNLTLKWSTKEFYSHTRTHHVVIIAMSTLFYSIMSRYTNSLFLHVLVNTEYLLNITFTLVAMSMILGRLEFRHVHYTLSFSCLK